MVSLERLENADEMESLRKLIAAHGEATTSPPAHRILAQWSGGSRPGPPMQLVRPSG
jgi:glutamate synthase domain-containing protein 3